MGINEFKKHFCFPISMEIWLATLLSVFIVSIISLIGVITLALSDTTLRKVVLYLVSFSTGALFGDVFLHMLPEVAEESGFTFGVSVAVLCGILVSFILEKIIQWRHCHHHDDDHVHAHPFAIMSLVADGLHNFIDGIIIAVSYMVSLPIGIATTMAVVFHEIPQELGNFGVLIHGGMSKTRALFYNFITAVTSVLGAVLTLLFSAHFEKVTYLLIPFAAGSFLYIAGSDLIPELHKEQSLSKSLLQLLFLILGILIIMSLLLLE